MAKIKFLRLIAPLILLACINASWAGEVNVEKVKVSKQSANTYSFSVTLKHADTGWKHYANKWEVLTLDGELLGQRILHHPHVNEQPFTRKLGKVKIPSGVSQVLIKGYDLKHGDGGKTKIVDLP